MQSNHALEPSAQCDWAAAAQRESLDSIEATIDVTRIYVPSTGPFSWKSLLARPDRHWQAGFSAMSLAQSWESAGDRFPPEVASLLESAGEPMLAGLTLHLAVPEYQVDLPGGHRPTQTDLFALAGNDIGLVAVAIEGKVDETFGPTVEAKHAEGAAERLDYLHRLLGLDSAVTGPIRYQLLHRTAAALLLAKRFHANAAAMVVHSFSPDGRWFDDFARFSELLGVTPDKGRAHRIGLPGMPLFIGWATGDQMFRKDLSGSAV